MTGIAPPLISRRQAVTLPLAVLTPAASGRVRGGPGPGTASWTRHASPDAAGFSGEGLLAFERALFSLPTTSVMIVSAGRIAYTYGDVDQVSYLASARKSVMSMMLGRYVADGRIRLDSTIGELGLDEPGGLLPIERTASVGDLLTSRSGVYYPAASIGSDPDTPERGSERPGARFVYNNWDFNVLGAILEKAAGRGVFDVFEHDLARPLGFEDYAPERQRMLRLKGARSRYPAYHMFLSARDAARLGLVMVRDGVWAGRQFVPGSWVRESTTLRVPAADIRPGSLMGYGYLWWIPSKAATDPAWNGAFLAAGNYGQFILGLPALDIVVVHRRAVTDTFAIARNTGDTTFSPAGVSSETFLRLADLVVAAATRRPHSLRSGV